jgi:predicted RNA binding protein YcfA (HicA-like mRNA interferase family)
MCKKNLDDCRSGHDLVDYSQHHGATVEPGKGSHTKVKTPRGTAIIPNHRGDLGTGIRCKLIKQLMVLLGLLTILITGLLIA